MSKWSEFYLKRINSTYQIYFKNMLELCKLNNSTLNVWQNNIFKAITKKVDIIVTHVILKNKKK